MQSLRAADRLLLTSATARKASGIGNVTGTTIAKTIARAAVPVVTAIAKEEESAEEVEVVVNDVDEPASAIVVVIESGGVGAAVVVAEDEGEIKIDADVEEAEEDEVKSVTAVVEAKVVAQVALKTVHVVVVKRPEIEVSLRGVVAQALLVCHPGRRPSREQREQSLRQNLW